MSLGQSTVREIQSKVSHSFCTLQKYAPWSKIFFDMKPKEICVLSTAKNMQVSVNGMNWMWNQNKNKYFKAI